MVVNLKVKMMLRDKDCELVETELPGHYEVCPRCGGEGHHTNPSIDFNGLSEDQESDSEFMEDYFDGKYDITCTICKGKRVISMYDVSKLTYAQKRMIVQTKLYDQYVCESNAIMEAERRFGA